MALEVAAHQTERVGGISPPVRRTMARRESMPVHRTGCLAMEMVETNRATGWDGRPSRSGYRPTNLPFQSPFSLINAILNRSSNHNISPPSAMLDAKYS